MRDLILGLGLALVVAGCVLLCCDVVDAGAVLMIAGAYPSVWGIWPRTGKPLTQRN